MIPQLRPFLFLLLLTSCQYGHDYVNTYENLYLMSAPSAENVKHFHDKGGLNVVEISDKNESERSFERVKGVTYKHFTDKSDKSISSENLTAISNYVTQLGQDKTIIHSDDISRVSFWLAHYLKSKKGQTAENAIKQAQDFGLTEAWEKNLKSSFETK